MSQKKSLGVLVIDLLPLANQGSSSAICEAAWSAVSHWFAVEPLMPTSRARSAPEARRTFMKTSELRAKDVAGLEKEVTDLLKAHFGLRMQKATQQLANHQTLGQTRRDIARAKTILAEKKKGAAK